MPRRRTKEKEVYLCGARVVVNEEGALVRAGASGRPSDTGYFGERTKRISVPVSLVPVIESLLVVMRRAHLARARCLRSVLVSDPFLTGDLAKILQGDDDTKDFDQELEDFGGVPGDEELEDVGSGPGAV